MDIPEEPLYDEGDGMFCDKGVDIADTDGNRRGSILVYTPLHAIFFPDFDSLPENLR